MRLLAGCLLMGLATAVAPFQHVLQQSKQLSNAWTADSTAKPLKVLEKSFKSLSSDARAAWDEVTALLPEAMDQLTFFSDPKKHSRRPDKEWDYIVKGVELESAFVLNENGEKERELDGDLEMYNLRGKKVDPSILGVDPGVKQYSGYLDDNENDKHLFYCEFQSYKYPSEMLIHLPPGFFESRNDPKNDPVVLWLSGGPGCSSLVGLFMELGPASIDKKLHVVNNPYSWNANASVLFLDQPVNTGLSYSDNSVSNTVAAGKDVYALLTLFFKQFPEYAEQDFHISGESYAGHYIPVFATEILKHKKRNINLKSLLIGNGLTDALNQYDQYRPMACGDGGWPAVLEPNQCRSMDNALPRCLALIEGCYENDNVWTCVPATIYCNNALMGPYQRTGRNVYDVRKDCDPGTSLCYAELDWISEWINKPEVLEAVGAEVDSFNSCNFDVNRNFLFAGDWMKPFHRLVPAILEEIPVLIYAVSLHFFNYRA